MRALLDMDGVLVNFIQGALEVHNIKQTVEELYADNLGEWDVVKILGMSPPAFWKPMNEEFWAKLDWMPDGEDIFEFVEGFFGPDNVYLWTSPSMNYGCIDGKMRWIERHLPKRYKTHTIFSSKKYVAANFVNVLIDDSDSNVRDFRNECGEAILVPRIWNSAHSDRHQVLQALNAICSSL